MRQFLAGAMALGAIASILAAPASAQDWPTKPIRILVGFGPGGGTDLAARFMAPPLSEILGQPVVVENKPGAGGTTAGDTVAKAAKDGYTAVVISNAHAVSAAVYKSLPYDPVKDFQFVSLIGTAGLIMVTRPDAPAKTVAEVIALAKANPGKLNFGNAGIGTTQHFSAELFGQLAGVQVKHIPYRTTPAAIAALRAKEIDYLFELIQTVRGPIAAGDLTAVAVTSPQRFPSVPNVPTMAEGGLQGYDVTSWYGLALPAGTPPAVVAKFNKAMGDALGRDSVKKQISDAGAMAKASSPDEFAKHIAAEIDKWKGVMAKAGMSKI